MEQEQTLGFRARRAITRFLVFCIVAGLVGVSAFLLAKLNSRSFRVEMFEGQLRVMRGKNLPVGFEPYRPSDTRLSDTYAPIPIPGDPPVDILSQVFSDRDELDRALFALLERMGRPKLFSEDPRETQEGLYFLRRAERLTGLTEEQRRALKNMQTDIAFHLGREKLDEARRMIAEAVTQLRLAADAPNRNARSAHLMLLEVGGPAKAMEEALQRAVHELSAPLPKAPEPEKPAPVVAPPSLEKAPDAGTALNVDKTPKH